jgi:hypothetical protein
MCSIEHAKMDIERFTDDAVLVVIFLAAADTLPSLKHLTSVFMGRILSFIQFTVKVYKELIIDIPLYESAHS